MIQDKAEARLNKYCSKCREIGSEGIVLIKNEDNVLPFTQDDVITIFGRSQLQYIRNGSGSGGNVNVNREVNLIEGFRNDGIKFNEAVVADYEQFIKKNRFIKGSWGCVPRTQKDMPISLQYSQKQAQVSNKALYIFSRSAGEDMDNDTDEGSYNLLQTEINNLKNITSAFEQVVVALNVTNVIDMKWVNDPQFQGRIKGVVYLWCGGMEGGNSAADILCGKVTPSGKLPDTIPFDLSDHPTFKNFGMCDKVLYEEDIYVGYRYFETFCPEKVQYEFGYGLSYTTFDVKTISAEHQENGKILMTVDVKNTGDKFNGKEVVQIYFSAPQGRLGKPVKQLISFEKTKLLNPGENQVLSFEFDEKDMASYDDSNITGNKSCYVLEEGDYRIYVGTSVKKVELALTFSIPQLKVVQRLSEVLCPNDDELKILTTGNQKEDGTYETKYIPSQKPTVNLGERIQANLPEPLTTTIEQPLTFEDVQQNKELLKDFVAQMPIDELAQLVRGEMIRKAAGCFGGLSKSLKEKKVPRVICADGPNGIHMNGPPTVQIPIATSIAASFNKDAAMEAYRMIGKEMRRNDIHLLLAPGVNIHRSLLNGRNFEYFSEDPYLTGVMATYTSKGLRGCGVASTVKHFALNSQETERRSVNSVCSERAIREIYIKAFEMSVKSGYVISIMTSYNPINGHWAASNYDLNTTILRGEWNYQGFVMTDWQAVMNDVVEGGGSSQSFTRDMIRAQNDIYMVLNQGGAFGNYNCDDTEDSIEEGRLTLAELQRCVMNLLTYLLNEVKNP